jgi:probable F420-dependent oxidoreductase
VDDDAAIQAVRDEDMKAPSRHYWGVITADFPAGVLTAQARQMEETGMEGIFAPQMYGPPFVPLAAAAAVTTRIKLASGIALAFARSPFETAMAAMDLDRISGGRFILGLGPSVRVFNEDFCGVPYGKPLEHLRETVAVIKSVIEKSHTGELKTFKGKYYDLDFREFQALSEPIRTDIPVWIAALRRPLVRLAAEIADGVMGHPIWSIPWATSKVQDAVKEGLQRAGKGRSDIHFNVWLFAAPNRDRSQSVNDARATVAFYAGIAQYEEYFAAHGFGAEARRIQESARKGGYQSAANLVPQDMAETFVVCGTPDEVRRKIEPIWEVADGLCLVPPAYGLSQENLLQYVATIAQTFYA